MSGIIIIHLEFAPGGLVNVAEGTSIAAKMLLPQMASKRTVACSFFAITSIAHANKSFVSRRFRIASRRCIPSPLAILAAALSRIIQGWLPRSSLTWLRLYSSTKPFAICTGSCFLLTC